MDYSFFRFLDDFDKAKDLQNSKLYEFDYDMQIHLKPGENYSSISNCPYEISFGSMFKAYIVNCQNEILADISSDTYIEEFSNSTNGLQQIKLELINLGLTLGLDYYTDLVFLRLDHDIVGGKKYWSNPFLLSNYDINETSRLRFKHYSDLDGTNYKVANIFQSIRLKLKKEKNTFISSSQSYTTFVGSKYTSRVIKTKQHEYQIDMCNDFIYDRLQYVLTHDIIYVNGFRVTDKQTFESSDKFSGSNIAQSKFKLSIDEDDIDDESTQIYQNFIPPTLVADYSPIDYNPLDYLTP